jgi:hypothetical protein
MKNNPLMIKRNNIFNFYGEIKEITDDREYKSFEDKCDGYRAFINIIRYYKRCGYNTLSKILGYLFEDKLEGEKCTIFISNKIGVHKDDIFNNKVQYILLCYHLYEYLHNEMECDTDSILMGFRNIYNYIPDGIEFKSQLAINNEQLIINNNANDTVKANSKQGKNGGKRKKGDTSKII